MADKDTICSEDLGHIYMCDKEDWETKETWSLKRDDFVTVKLWAWIKRTAGAASVFFPIRVTDGVLQYVSTGLSTTQTSWDPKGPDSLTIRSSADKHWKLQLQMKCDSGCTAEVQGPLFQREKA